MSNAIMPIYAPAPVSPVRGEGAWLIESDGTRWLDCIGGVATTALGHCHPALVGALTDQAAQLWHVSNALRIPGQQALAAKLTAACFADVAFFCNSGTEAVEAAIKTARRYHSTRGAPERIDVIGFHGSFHGRTYAAINAAGNAAYLEGLGPALPGYLHLAIDDHDGLAAAAARGTTAAVIVEPVQGEGGARALVDADLVRIRRVCDANGILLIHDEVQSGMGRTGRLFAHQWVEGASPDIMAIAKALGGGFPVGACLATHAAASGMTVAAHGSTFGGNPLAMAVAGAAFDVISDPETLAHARAVAIRLRDGLGDLVGDVVTEVRGKGLLIGLKLAPNNRAFIAAARDHHLLLSGCGDNCARILPPLTLGFDEADIIVDRVAATIACHAFAEAA
ncbi:aspartate aminotransferase family protein [uncultured Sphingomonas sp.]|uniref:aspartate aminotransferase family protein n=1 Tax=uncultured Sphingomonas sp. TaxID=158754 RepID=UPI0035C9A888